MDELILRCRVCEEKIVMRPLRNLNCGHSLCLECVDQILPEASDIRCPDCHELFTAKETSNVKLTFPWLRLSHPQLSSEFENSVESVSNQTDENSFKNPVSKINGVYIDDYGQGPFWRVYLPDYTCQIISPKTQQNSYGARHHVTYGILPSFSNTHILRTYGDFESLYNRLAVIYPFVVLPPLPGKPMIGTCVHEFTEKQRSLLQNWIDRICRHPVLSQSILFQQFITGSEQKSWENSYEEESIYESLIKCLFDNNTLEYSSNLSEFQRLVKAQELFIGTLSKELVSLQSICRIIADSYATFYKQEYDTLSFSFKRLGQALKLDRSSLPEIMHHISQAYFDIGKIWEMEDGKDWRSLENLFLEYQILLEGLSKTCNFASRTFNHCKWSSPEVSVSGDGSTGTKERSVVSCALQAEIDHFHQQITRDFGTTVKAFIVAQIHLYQRITERLREGLEKVISGDDENSASFFGT
ncbi:sorting nexin-33-like [Palaemon carinicauda]|uniref:sorting nexin-33-like n=1 Tax=Palaemon carinicauda TaxID=392227 RepID=UPI0035B60E99